MNLFKIMQGIRSLAQAGKIDYPGAVKYLNDLGVQMDGIVKQALDNVFKKGKARDPEFGDTVVKMQIDEEGIPYNPKTLQSTSEKRGVENLFIRKEAEKPGDPGWIKDGDPITEENFGTSQFAPSKEGIENRRKAKNLPEVKMGSRINYDLIAEREGIDVELIRGKKWSEIMEIISAVRDKADGGRIGFNQGGTGWEYEPLFTENVERFTAPIGLTQKEIPSRINKAYTDATNEAFNIGRVAAKTGLTNPESIMKVSESPTAIRTLSDINMMDRKNISDPYSKFEKQGLSSDYRHTLGTSAFKDSIIDYLGSNLGIDKQSGILDTIGSVAAKGATVFEEGKDALSQIKAYQDIDPYSGIQDYGTTPSGLKLSEILAQPIEDFEANFFAADQIPFGTSPLKKMEMIQAYKKFGRDNYMQQLENQKKAAMQEQIRKAEAEAARKKQITQQLQTAAGNAGGYQPTTTAQNVARTSSRVGPGGNVKAYGLKEGGRVGFQTGGWADDLTGQAAAIYQSMNLGGHSDATIQNTLKSLGYWDGDTGGGGGGVENIINTQQSIIPGAAGARDDPYAGQVVDQTSFADYQFDKSDYAPGGKLEINPAALGMSFFEQPGSGKVKDQLPASFVEANKHLTPNQQKDKYYTGKEVGVDYGPLEAKEPGFMESFMSAAVPNKMTSEFRTPTGIIPKGPQELGFMTKDIFGKPYGSANTLNRDQLMAMYDDYNKFFGRGSNYQMARVPGTVGNLMNIIPYAGPVKRGLEAIFGPAGDKSLRSKYTVDNAGYGNTGMRDEFGVATFDKKDGFLGLSGNTTRDYVNRMEDQMDKNIDFFGGKRTTLTGKPSKKTGRSVDNFAERWANFDDLDAADQQALINEMKAINSFKAKQMLAYKNRIATEKINKDWQQKQEDIATQEKIDAEKDFVTQDLGVTTADAASSGKGMDHTRGMTSRERGKAAARMGSGSRQAKSGSQKAGGSGRTDKGWGWAHGGPVSVASMFTRRR